MPHCVMVAQQILVLYVWVRVLVGQQKFLLKYLIDCVINRFCLLYPPQNLAFFHFHSLLDTSVY